jgi:hypothetical protein
MLLAVCAKLNITTASPGASSALAVPQSATPSMDSPLLVLSNLSMRAPSAASSAHSSTRSGNAGTLLLSSADNILTWHKQFVLVQLSLVGWLCDREAGLHLATQVGSHQAHEYDSRSGMACTICNSYNSNLHLLLKQRRRRNRTFLSFPIDHRKCPINVRTGSIPYTQMVRNMSDKCMHAISRLAQFFHRSTWLSDP